MRPRYGMIAPMGKGTRAAGGAGRRRSGAPDSDSAQATQTQRQAPGQAPRPAAAPAAAGPAPGGRPRSGRGATFSVVLMTLIALAAVGVLAAQAEATAPRVRAQATEAASTKGSTKSGGSAANPAALPADSGSGTRIVYSPTLRRVWLAEGQTVERTMEVVPGTITPPAGTFSVYAKSPGSVGGDGVAVVDLVRFDSSSSTSFGFDAEADITGLPPAPKGSTGGVRMTQLDAQALYEFASVGTTVVVL